MAISHIVRYYESERGWGGEIWYRRFSTKEEALGEVEDCNNRLPDECPDYYIFASYEGVDENNDPRYDVMYRH